jgi:predicted O-methyltransferase YrrM
MESSAASDVYKRLVQLCTGHTRQLLPDFAKQSFGAVFMDLWGSQYTEALAPWLLDDDG